jgi:hypothetical protein
LNILTAQCRFRRDLGLDGTADLLVVRWCRGGRCLLGNRRWLSRRGRLFRREERVFAAASQNHKTGQNCQRNIASYQKINLHGKILFLLPNVP